MPSSSETIPATSAKNQFGRLLESAMQGRRVVITKHDVPKAILMSMDEYNSLTEKRPNLNLLTEEFDALLAGMQTPKARAAMRSLFRATPKQLGRAALAAARKRA
jgi:prevent-host-death family protein